VLLFFGVLIPQPALAQKQAAEMDQAPSGRENPQVPDQVGVQQVSSNRAIEKRLTNILESTGWFEGIDVEVKRKRPNTRKRSQLPNLRRFPSLKWLPRRLKGTSLAMKNNWKSRPGETEILKRAWTFSKKTIRENKSFFSVPRASRPVDRTFLPRYSDLLYF
jgi:hypothetical protein